MFDADLTFHDLDLATHPEVKDALTDGDAHLRDVTGPGHCAGCTNLSLLPNGSRMPASMP